MFLTENLVDLAHGFGWTRSYVTGHFVSKLLFGLCRLLVQSSETVDRGKNACIEGSVDMACWVRGWGLILGVVL